MHAPAEGGDIMTQTRRLDGTDTSAATISDASPTTDSPATPTPTPSEGSSSQASSSSPSPSPSPLPTPTTVSSPATAELDKKLRAWCRSEEQQTPTIVCTGHPGNLNSDFMHTVNILELNQLGRHHTWPAFDFSAMTNLTDLRMDGISMNDHAPTLTIPSTLNSLSIKGSQLVDLKLQMSTQGPNASAKLKTLELTNNDFTTIPTCLQTGTVKNLTVLHLNVPKQVNLGAEEFSRFSTNYHDALPTKVNANDGVLSQEQVDKDCSATGVLVCMSGSTASAPTNKGSSGSSISAGAIVGIALGAVAVIAIIAFMLLRRRRSNSPDKGPQSSYLSCPTPAYSPRRSAARGGHEVAGASDLPVLLYEEISIAEPQGAKHLCGAKFQGEKVLLKRLKADITDAHVARQLQAQARLLLANQHPNIVQIRGVTMVNGMDFSVVAEFMDKGSLRMALKDAKIILSVRDRISLCADIAEALQFLHDPSRKMYVRRLTSQKVLVNSQLTCKINLFECHPIASDARNVNAYGTGELAWTAPELIMGDDKVDVRMCNMFALGVIICETITGAAPYASEVESLGSTLADFEIKKRVKRHEHLTPHEHSAAFHDAPIQLQKLVESCLAINPRDRPTAARAAAVLKEVLQDMPRGSETF